MKPDGRTSTQMHWFGEPLPNWNEVHNSDGSRAGSNERTGGITKHYGPGGNLTAITDSKGVTRDLSGNPTSKPYGK